MTLFRLSRVALHRVWRPSTASRSMAAGKTGRLTAESSLILLAEEG